MFTSYMYVYIYIYTCHLKIVVLLSVDKRGIHSHTQRF